MNSEVMCDRSRLHLLAVAVICVWARCPASARADGPAVYIDNPTTGSCYDPASNIVAAGHASIGNLQIVVKLIKGTTRKQEKTASSDPGTTLHYWSATFEPPSGGWEEGTDWKIEVWLQGEKDDEVTFTIGDCTPPPP